jgi:hypothetical protein
VVVVFKTPGDSGAFSSDVTAATTTLVCVYFYTAAALVVLP